MEESRKVYGWLVRDGNAAVGCSYMWTDILRGEYYCGNLLWQSSLTLLFRLVIMPMLLKLRAARCLLKTSAEYDILMSPEYGDLKMILDAIDDSHLGIAEHKSYGASM